MKNFFLLLSLLIPATLFSQIKKLAVESNHSTVGFRISISGFTEVTGKFSDFSVNMDWDENDLPASSISAEIKAGSIDTGIDGRDEHLRSADFFEVEKYPDITFKSSEIKRVNHYQFLATGKFTMHGVTKNMELPFELVKKDGNTLGFRCRTKINRKDYGVGSSFQHDTMPDFLSDEIQVEIDFWTKKRKE